MKRPSPPSRLAATLDKLPGGWKTLLIVGVLIAAGGVSAGLLARSHRTVKPAAVVQDPPPPPPVAVSPASNFPLELEATTESNGSILLHWNPQSALIEQAREGRMVVTEASQTPNTIAVSLEQLKLGSMSYVPHSERVDFRLEVVDRSGPVAEESVVALNPAGTGNTLPSAAAPASQR